MWITELRKGLAARVAGITGNEELLMVHSEDSFYLGSARATVEELQERLKEAGLWGWPGEEGRRGERAYWEGMGGRAKRMSLEIRFAGDLPTAVRGLFVGLGREMEGHDRLQVIATDDYLRPEIGDMLRNGLPTLLTKPVGMELWMGPLLDGDERERWEELCYWLRGKRADRARVSGWGYPPAIGVAGTDWQIVLGMSMVAGAVGVLECGGQAELRDLLTLDLRTMRQQVHCARRSVEFRPEQWVSAKTGVVERIPREVHRFGLHHAQAQFVLPPLEGNRHRQKTRGYAYGSGWNGEQARSMAIYEAVERYSTYFDGEEEFCVHRYDSETCIHPNELMLFSEEQYADGGQGVPERFDEEIPIAWMPGRALGSYPDRWVPAALVLMDYSDAEQGGFAITESTGCAAGPTREAAIEAGWRELVERDAVAMWWYRQAYRPGWEWEKAGTERTRELGREIVKEGWELEVLDLTTGFGVRVAVAIGSREGGMGPVFGAGAGMGMQEAVGKAIAELAQVLTWKEALEDRSVYGLERVAEFQKGHMVAAGIGRASSERRRYAVDLTRRRIGLPVVKVVSPGMQPNGLRLGGTRLTAGVEELGWRCGTDTREMRRAVPCPL